MLNRAKCFVLVLALAVLPAQGMAGAFANLNCHSAVGEHSMHGTHANGGHAPGATSQGRTDDGGAHDTDHASCHPLTPVLPVVLMPASVAEFPVWTPSSYALPNLFIPDRPQRPPLA